MTVDVNFLSEGKCVQKMSIKAPLITPLKNERAYKRGNGDQIIAINEYSTEFRTKYFWTQRNARYADMTGGQRKDLDGM